MLVCIQRHPVGMHIFVFLVTRTPGIETEALLSSAGLQGTERPLKSLALKS